MITAVDTNVLVDVLTGDEQHAAASARALSTCVREGSVIASEVVWAETAAGYRDLGAFREAMKRLGVEFAPLQRAAAEAASAAWRLYRVHGGTRSRIVGDFLVGAHAQHQAERLLTRDRGFVRRYFAQLLVVDPSSDGSSGG